MVRCFNTYVAYNRYDQGAAALLLAGRYTIHIIDLFLVLVEYFEKENV